MGKKGPTCCCAAALCLAVSASWVAAPGQVPPPPVREARLRRPVAAALLADGHTLCVANRRSGSVSLVDLGRPQVRDEVTAGRSLAGLALLPDRKHVLVIDDQAHELVALSFDGSRLSVRARVPV